MWFRRPWQSHEQRSIDLEPRGICLTQFDLARLYVLLQVDSSFKERDCNYLESLQHELDRAHIADLIAIPHNVGTMNSRVRL